MAVLVLLARADKETGPVGDPNLFNILAFYLAVFLSMGAAYGPVLIPVAAWIAYRAQEQSAWTRKEGVVAWSAIALALMCAVGFHGLLANLVPLP
jgi:hypothetical protein